MHLASGRLAGVDHQERVHDRVDLGGAHDAGQDRVALVGAHVLGAVEGHGGLAGVEADDDVDVGLGLQRLRDAAAPERAKPGDEYPAPHASALPAAYPNQTLRRRLSMSYSSVWMVWRMSSDVSMILLRE